VRTTVGVPGTGLSYTEGGGIEQPTTPPRVDPEPTTGVSWRGWLFMAVVSVLIAFIVTNLIK
jgi:hypothetical protein